MLRRRHLFGPGLLLLALLGACGEATPTTPTAAPDASSAESSPIATFSIAAYDPETGDLGVAVQSRFFGVGVVVPWVRADVGAVATQALANPDFGPDGLALLDDGMASDIALKRLLAADPGRERRQVGLVDSFGRAAAHTGKNCLPWAGHVVGKHYCCQGNILAGAKVVKAMAKAFEASKAALPERLVEALRAGQAAGGDKRGRQSAALVVVRRFGGYRGANDRYVDVRVDDHPRPIEELGRLLVLRRSSLRDAPVPRRLSDAESHVREPRTGLGVRPSARETWLRWKALHRVRDWEQIHAMAVSNYRSDHDVAALERLEKGSKSTQALARRGVYLGTHLAPEVAKLYFAVRGGDEPIMVLLSKEKGQWRIVP